MVEVEVEVSPGVVVGDCDVVASNLTAGGRRKRRRGSQCQAMWWEMTVIRGKLLVFTKQGSQT